MDNSIHNGEVYENQWDHRKIGKEQELFSFHEEGPGLPFFLPKGMAIKNQLIEYWRQAHKEAGYQEIQSPMLLDRKLWEQSGHWQLFKENMYVSEVEKRMFAIKPMNCPGAILYYKEKKRSHSEMPFRVCELGQVHRDENSGSLHGLLRVRSFVVDDGHIFCAREQLLSEVKGVIALFLEFLEKFGFDDFDFELSVRGKGKADKYLGSDDDWKFAEGILSSAIKDFGIPCISKEGEAKFYGPAIDVKIRDSSGRMWQCSSIQMDFNLPARFGLVYYDKEGKRQVPYLLHRAIYGSLERFFGMLIEHYKGVLPIWLAPVQCKVLCLSDDSQFYGREIVDWLQERNIRCEWDAKDENLSAKIKRAQEQRIPVMILVGNQEVASRKLSVRLLNGQQHRLIDIPDILKFLQK